MNQELSIKNYDKFSIDSRALWLFIGVAIFAVIAFVLPVPESRGKGNRT